MFACSFLMNEALVIPMDRTTHVLEDLILKITVFQETQGMFSCCTMARLALCAGCLVLQLVLLHLVLL
jgi:hypothetical protein